MRVPSADVHLSGLDAKVRLDENRDRTKRPAECAVRVHGTIGWNVAREVDALQQRDGVHGVERRCAERRIHTPEVALKERQPLRLRANGPGDVVIRRIGDWQGPRRTHERLLKSVRETECAKWCGRS